MCLSFFLGIRFATLTWRRRFDRIAKDLADTMVEIYEGLETEAGRSDFKNSSRKLLAQTFEEFLKRKGGI